MIKIKTLLAIVEEKNGSYNNIISNTQKGKEDATSFASFKYLKYK